MFRIFHYLHISIYKYLCIFSLNSWETVLLLGLILFIHLQWGLFFVVYSYILIARVQKFYILAKLVLNKIIIFLSVQRTLLLRLNYPEGILCMRSFFNLINHCCFLTFVTKAKFWLQENIFILSNIKLTKRWILRTQVYIHHLV